MARGGINKALVQKARQMLVARGENPSIDAVRVELGNTGSKTTIHRYLRELEERDLRQNPEQPDLGQELSTLVAQLAARLKEEGAEPIERAQAQFAAEKAELQHQLHEAQRALSNLQQRFDIQSAALNRESEELKISRTTLQAEQTRNARIGQAHDDLELRLKDKEEHLVSLEEKHQHAREALEHYRSAVKEQREQEQRRHEGQVQQVQMELRQLQQTLLVKQDELTRLNRDNERLLNEARQLQKQRLADKDLGERQNAEINGLQILVAQGEGARQVMQSRVTELKTDLLQANEDLIAHRQLASRVEEQNLILSRELADRLTELSALQAAAEQ